MNEFEDLTTGEIKSRQQLIAGFSGALPKVWKPATLLSLNVRPVLSVPKPQPSSPLKVISRDGQADDGNGNRIPNYVEVDRFESQEALDAYIATRLAERIQEVRNRAAECRDGGITINGLAVSTSASARTLLTGAAENPLPTRKIVTSGGRAEVTEAQFAGIYAAVVAYIQSVTDQEFDLLEALETAAGVGLVELEAVDSAAGWPSSTITT